ncbi:hypothetical protein ACFV27_21330, partial [Streptomyces antimycoticus]
REHPLGRPRRSTSRTPRTPPPTRADDIFGKRNVDYARAAAEAGVHKLFVDFGQTPATLAQRVDLAGRFIEGARHG